MSGRLYPFSSARIPHRHYNAGTFGSRLYVAAVVSVICFASPAHLSAGGLTARYYNNCCLSGSTVDKVDSRINMNLTSGTPVDGIDKEYWSVRWTGQIELPQSGTYAFRFKHDDGIRMWLNGDLLIDKYSMSVQGTDNASFSAPEPGSYPIRIEFMDIYDEHMCIFSWQKPGGSMEVVPENVLTPTGGPKVCDNAIPRPYMGVVSESNPIVLETLTPDAEVYYTTDGTEPTRQSTRYTGPFALNSDGIVKTLVVKDGWEDSHVYESREFVAYKGEGGDGLKAVFTNKFTGATTERIDPYIDIFDHNGERWGPFQDPVTGQDAYEVTWTGDVVPETGGSYTFFFKGDDRITVNIEGVGSGVAEWGGGSISEESIGPVQLNAQQRYPLRVTFYDQGHHGEAITYLKWSGPGIAKQVVPQKVLYSGVDHETGVYRAASPGAEPRCSPMKSRRSRVLLSGLPSLGTENRVSTGVLIRNQWGIFDLRGRAAARIPARSAPVPFEGVRETN